MNNINCEAADPGDMDFCLQCPFYFECDLKDAVSPLAVLDASSASCEVSNE